MGDGERANQQVHAAIDNARRRADDALRRAAETLAEARALGAEAERQVSVGHNAVPPSEPGHLPVRYDVRADGTAEGTVSQRSDDSSERR